MQHKDLLLFFVISNGFVICHLYTINSWIQCSAGKITTFKIFMYSSTVKWSILAHLKSQPRGKNFQAQKPVERSSPHQTRINKNTKNTLKIN